MIDHPQNRWLTVPEILIHSSNIGTARIDRDLLPRLAGVAGQIEGQRAVAAHGWPLHGPRRNHARERRWDVSARAAVSGAAIGTRESRGEIFDEDRSKKMIVTPRWKTVMSCRVKLGVTLN